MKPWERQEAESARAYEAFSLYRDMGPQRSYRAVREKLGRSSGYERHLEAWAARFDWVSRANAWDDLLSAERLEEARKGERAAAAEATMASNKLFYLIRLAIERLVEQVEGGKRDISPKELACLTSSAKTLREQTGELGKLVESLSSAAPDDYRQVFDDWLAAARPDAR